jgi:hypothetical protein
MTRAASDPSTSRATRPRGRPATLLSFLFTALAMLTPPSAVIGGLAAIALAVVGWRRGDRLGRVALGLAVRSESSHGLEGKARPPQTHDGNQNGSARWVVPEVSGNAPAGVTVEQECGQRRAERDDLACRTDQHHHGQVGAGTDRENATEVVSGAEPRAGRLPPPAGA